MKIGPCNINKKFVFGAALAGIAVSYLYLKDSPGIVGCSAYKIDLFFREYFRDMDGSELARCTRKVNEVREYISTAPYEGINKVNPFTVLFDHYIGLTCERESIYQSIRIGAEYIQKATKEFYCNETVSSAESAQLVEIDAFHEAQNVFSALKKRMVIVDPNV